MFNPKNKKRRHALFYVFDTVSVLISLAFASSSITLLNVSIADNTISYASITQMLSVLLLLPIFHLAVGLYDTKIRQSIRGVFRRTILSSALMFSFVTAVSSVIFNSPLPMLHSFLCLSVSCALHTGWRLWVVYHGGIDSVKRKVIFIGAGKRASFASSRMRRFVDRKHFVFCGFLPLFRKSGSEPIINSSIANNETVIQHDDDDINNLIRNADADIFVLANDKSEVLPLEGLLDAKMRGAEIVEMEDFVESELGQIAVENMKGEWLLSSKGFTFSREGYGAFHYLFNALIATVVLALTWPLMVLAMIAIYFDDGRKDKDATFLYRQVRVGLNGKLFSIVKFRSMGKDAEKDGAAWATKNDMRVTRVGKYLRKYRIDELPQLVNVFKGEMCFVGPRPERPEFVSELSKEIPFFDYRHFVKPGLTGWAQVKYPYGASKKDSLEKLKFDLYYIKHKSVLMDILVLIRTVETILFGSGR